MIWLIIKTIVVGLLITNWIGDAIISFKEHKYYQFGADIALFIMSVLVLIKMIF